MKKIILNLLGVFILASCVPNNYANVKCTPQVPEVEKVKTICPQCNGVGKVKPSLTEVVGLAIVTSGLGLLCADDLQTCDMCHGKGYVLIPALDK